MAEYVLFEGDALTMLDSVNDETVDCCVTSPPYFKKRDYGHEKQLGQEKTPEQFIQNLAAVFDGIKRVLKPTGSLWINIDDTYVNGQLAGIPHRLVFELQRRGWFWRADPIWYKTGTTPEPVKNRVSRTHEYLFHLTKQPSGYYYDADSVRDPHTNPWVLDCLAKFAADPTSKPRVNLFSKSERYEKDQKGMTRAEFGSRMNPKGKNKRSMWTEQKWFRLKPNLTEDQIKFVLDQLSAYATDTGGK